MALRRVFVDSISAGRAVATGSRAHHLARVVRLRQGEHVEVSDGSQAWLAVAESIDPRSVVFSVLEVVPAIPPTPQVDLYLALIKFPRLEWAIEKATELGVATIVPVAAERSDGSLLKAASKRVERWERIAEEAAQQARRLAAPVVAAPCSFGDALDRSANVRIFLNFDGRQLTREALQPVPSTGRIAVLIGPEGGWTDSEVVAAQDAGAIGVALGSGVLRSETAAIAVVSILGELLRSVE